MSVMMGLNGGGPGGGTGTTPTADILYQETECSLSPFQESGCSLSSEGLSEEASAAPHHELSHSLDYSSDLDSLASSSSHHPPFTPDPPALCPQFDPLPNNNNSGGGGRGQDAEGRPRRRRRTPPKAKFDINDNSLYSVYCFFKSLLSASTASTVAIDNKIEQAMDLVKSHLMFAVREEVEVLKEKITELMERISQLEYENMVLRQYATQEALQQIQQPHHSSNT